MSQSPPRSVREHFVFIEKLLGTEASGGDSFSSGATAN